MNSYKIAIIGAGPAGMMAGIRVSQLLGGSGGIVVLEKNASCGRKLGLTGQGRCNITNACPSDEFFGHFGKNGLFLRDALNCLSQEALMRFFEDKGLKLKTERQERVFPVTESARSVTDVLVKALTQLGVEIRLGYPVKAIVPVDGGRFKIEIKDGIDILVSKVIIAVGGASYPQTGSTGDGFEVAKSLGHAITNIFGGLTPLETEEKFVKDLQGLALKNIRITFEADGKKIESGVGELLFTHFGVSGPLILDLSGSVGALLDKSKTVKMFIDLKPGLAASELDKKFQSEFQELGRAKFKNYLEDILPVRLAEFFLREFSFDPEKACHQVTTQERKKIIDGLKRFSLTIKRARPLAEAMVTCGGVTLKEINPKTMESKKIKGVYFCGEVLDLAADSGGFNLQAAFSTGYLAGEAAAKSCK